MAYRWQRWLGKELAAAGLEVREVAGWENRGRPASSGAFDPRGIVTHHVGARTSATNPTAGLQLLVDGRPDLRGPLAHVATDYLGRVWLIAAGRANVNGPSRGVPGFPERDGNAVLLGDEVMTDGTQPLPAAQRHAIAVVNLVVATHYGTPLEHLYRHADISRSGKWDLGQLSTAQLRADARTLVRRPTPATPVVTPQEAPTMIVVVKDNAHVHTWDGYHDPLWVRDIGDLSRLGPGLDRMPRVNMTSGEFDAWVARMHASRQEWPNVRDAVAEKAAERTVAWGHNPAYNPGTVLHPASSAQLDELLAKVTELAEAAAAARPAVGG